MLEQYEAEGKLALMEKEGSLVQTVKVATTSF